MGYSRFCSVDLENWLKEKNIFFHGKPILIETEHLVRQRLDELVVRGTLYYFNKKELEKLDLTPDLMLVVSVKPTRESEVNEAWFIFINLGSLPAAINAYKQRMGLEKM